MQKITKYISLIILFIAFFITGCASTSPNDKGENAIDGVAYYQYKQFEFEEILYSIYSLEKVNFIDEAIEYEYSALKYFYTEYNKLNVNEWTLNYYQDTLRKFNDPNTPKELFKTFYLNIQDSLNEYQKELGLIFDKYENEADFEKEFIVDMSKDFQSILIIDLYLPYQLKNENSKQIYYLNVPVKSCIAYRNGDYLSFEYDNKNITILYEAFISLNDVYKI